MLLTFREMQRQVQAKLQNTDTSTSNANDLLPKIKDWLNARYERVFRSFPWLEVINDTTLTLTASQTEYALDRDIARIIKIYDQTNGKVVTRDTIENHIRVNAAALDRTGNVISDNPTRYRLIGTHTVKAELSEAETVDVVSSNNTTDISPNVVHIEGLVNGVSLGEDIVLTGTTSATSTNTYDSGQKLVISVGTSSGERKTISGVITVTGTSSGDTLTEIQPPEYAHKYQWIKVSPTPKATGTQPTWLIWYQRQYVALDSDNDVPILDCSLEIVQGAFADALREDGLEQEAQIAEQTYVIMTKELQSTQEQRDGIEQFKPVDSNYQSSIHNDYDWIP